MSEVSLDELFVQHLETVMQRADRSLAASGFDALVIHAGRPPTQFLDDQDYPYKVNPHFKAWVPIVDNPQLPADLCAGHAVPGVVLSTQRLLAQTSPPARRSHGLPRLTLRRCRIRHRAAAQWAKLGRVAFIGPSECFPDAAAQCGAIIRSCSRACTTIARSRPTTSSSACAGRARWARAVTWRARGISPRSVRIRRHMKYLEACVQREEEMPYNNIVAYNEHAAVLHYQHLDRRQPQPLRSFLIDAGAQYRGYAVGHHSHLRRAAGPYADLIPALNAAQLRLVRRKSSRDAITARCTCRRTGSWAISCSRSD